MNLYICLNIASMMKDNAEREKEERRKIEQQYQMNKR
jgi:hypothetical protein